MKGGFVPNVTSSLEEVDGMSVSRYDNFRMLLKPPSWPKGAPKLTLGFFLSLMPPCSNSCWTCASRDSRGDFEALLGDMTAELNELEFFSEYDIAAVTVLTGAIGSSESLLR